MESDKCEISMKTLLSLLTIVACATAFGRTERGSFLEVHADSRSDLVKSLNDARVAKRYQRHFGMTTVGLRTMFAGLSLTTLKTTGKYRVYNVNDSGVIQWKMLRLTAGTAVYANRKGVPILKKSCGNPMARGTDGRQFTDAIEADIEDPTDVLALKPVREVDDAVGGGGDESTLLAASNPPSMLGNDTPVIDEMIVNGVPGIPSTSSIISPSGVSGAGAGGAALGTAGLLTALGGVGTVGALGAVGVAAAIITEANGGGSGSGGAPVPEPVTLVVLGAGVVGLARRRRKPSA
jgi:hypothetical protein